MVRSCNEITEEGHVGNGWMVMGVYGRERGKGKPDQKLMDIIKHDLTVKGLPAK